MVVFENESALELETLRLRADEALRLGRPDEALPPLCSALTSHPEDRELYVAATNALIESVESGRKFEGRSAEVRDRCLRALILQPRRIGRPPVLAHALASRITSHDVSVLQIGRAHV